ncbi:MAG: hypothetical protein R3F39_03015 [Myxococcota bacterium]
MSTVRTLAGAVLCVLFAASSACDEARTPFVIPDGGSNASPLCVPGATQACLCAAGASSVQSCNQSGSGWSPCECLAPTPDVVVDTTPTPDAVVDTTPTPDAVVDTTPTPDAVVDTSPTPDAAVWNPTVVGSACTGDHDCGGYTCMTSELLVAFGASDLKVPGGMCTELLCDASSCGDGASCVDLEVMFGASVRICLKNCVGAADCRHDEDYACAPVFETGAQKYCLPASFIAELD